MGGALAVKEASPPPGIVGTVELAVEPVGATIPEDPVLALPVGNDPDGLEPPPPTAGDDGDGGDEAEADAVPEPGAKVEEAPKVELPAFVTPSTVDSEDGIDAVGATVAVVAAGEVGTTAETDPEDELGGLLGGAEAIVELEGVLIRIGVEEVPGGGAAADSASTLVGEEAAPKAVAGESALQ